MRKKTLCAAIAVMTLCGQVSARTFKSMDEANAWAAAEEKRLAYLLAESLCIREIRSLSTRPQGVQIKVETTTLPPTLEGGRGTVLLRVLGSFGAPEEARRFMGSCTIRSNNGQNYAVEGLTFMPDLSQ